MQPRVSAARKRGFVTHAPKDCHARWIPAPAVEGTVQPPGGDKEIRRLPLLPRGLHRGDGFGNHKVPIRLKIRLVYRVELAPEPDEIRRRMAVGLPHEDVLHGKAQRLTCL